MERSEIIGTLITYVKKEFFAGNEASVDEKTALLTSGLIDSLNALKLIDFIEEEFSIELDPHEVDQDYLDNIELISDLISKKKA